MPNGTRAACPRCHFEQVLSITFQDVTVIGAAMNVAVECPICRNVFDAAPTGDGTFSTMDGRLQRVRAAAEVLPDMTVQEFTELAEQLRAVQRGDVTIDQAAEDATDDRIRRFWDMLPRTRSELYAVLALLVTLVNVILVNLPKDSDGVSPDVVREIVDQLERLHVDAPEPAQQPQPPASPSQGPETPTPPSSAP